MSILSELQQQIDEIPEQVLNLLKQEAGTSTDDMPEAETSPALSLLPAIQSLTELVRAEPAVSEPLNSASAIATPASTEFFADAMDELRQLARQADAAPPGQADLPHGATERTDAGLENLSTLAGQPHATDRTDAGLESLSTLAGQQQPFTHDLEPVTELARQQPMDLQANLPDFAKDDPGQMAMMGPLSTIGAGDEVSRLAGSAHSQELDVLEAPGGGVVDLLTRIAEGVEELVEQSRGSLGSSSMGRSAFTGPMPTRQDIGWDTPPAWSSGSAAPPMRETWSPGSTLPPIRSPRPSTTPDDDD